MKSKSILEAISALLILLYSYAALSKLSHYDTFIFQLSESPFRLLSKSAHWIAWLVPAIELIVGLLLPFIKTRLFALYASGALMGIFTIYVGVLLVSGLPLPCACGGIISGLHWKGHLVFNGFFLMISVMGILIERKNKSKITHPFFSTYLPGQR